MEKQNRSLLRNPFVSPIYILFILCIIGDFYSYSQTDSTNQKKWSVGIYGGVFVPTYDFTNKYIISPNLSLKIEYNLKSFLSLYLKSEYSFLSGYNNYIIITDERPKMYSRCISTTLGIKYRPIDSFQGLFTQLGVGHFYIEKQYTGSLYGMSDKVSNNFGFNFGLGYEFPISKYFKIEFGTLYNFINTQGTGTSTYISLYVGVSFKL